VDSQTLPPVAAPHQSQDGGGDHPGHGGSGDEPGGWIAAGSRRGGVVAVVLWYSC